MQRLQQDSIWHTRFFFGYLKKKIRLNSHNFKIPLLPQLSEMNGQLFNLHLGMACCSSFLKVWPSMLQWDLSPLIICPQMWMMNIWKSLLKSLTLLFLTPVLDLSNWPWDFKCQCYFCGGKTSSLFDMMWKTLTLDCKNLLFHPFFFFLFLFPFFCFLSHTQIV